MSKKMFEDTINELLTDEAKKNALDFVAYLRANEIAPQGSSGCEVFSFQNKPVCVVFVNGAEEIPGPWTIWHSGYDPKYSPNEIPDGEDADKIGLTDISVDEQLKRIAWDHVNICGRCGCGRQPGRHTTIFGKEFDNVCTSTLAFTNPDVETLQYVKKLTEVMKKGIKNKFK